MILNSTDAANIEIIEDLKKRLDFIESHKTLNLITEQQYNDMLKSVVEEIVVLEQQYNIKQMPTETVVDKLKKCLRTLQDIEDDLKSMFPIYKEKDFDLDDMFCKVLKSAGFTDEEVYDTLVHKTIEEIKNVE